MSYRDSTIAISNATRWKLTRIVKALNGSVGDDMTPLASVDAFADKLLADWITANHPELNELWAGRENADALAAALLEKKFPKRVTIEPVTVPF